MPEAQTEFLELAAKAARVAGELLLERFRGPRLGVGTKTSPTDLVSDADRDAETLILESVRSMRPDDGIIGEEGANRRSDSGIRWIIDPLDGTVNFLFGIPVWSVSIAVEDEVGVFVGVVYDANRDELFSACRGQGARLNDEPITVTSCTDLAQALIGTGFAYDAASRAVQADRLPRVLPKVRDIRRAGSAAIDLAWLAAGRFDGFFEAPMMLWDKAAGILLVQEAGGVVSELQAPAGDDHGVVAASPVLHDELRALVLG